MTLEEFAQLFEELFPKHDFNWKPYPNRWMGLCPFHEEKHHSFNIYQIGDSLFYKCFACGESGTIWDIKQKLGIIDGKPRKEQGFYKEAVSFVEQANKEMLSNYTTTLLPHKTGRDNLEGAIKFFRIGLITESLLDFNNPLIKRLEEKIKISTKIGWLVFPYYSLSGHLVAIKFRNIESSSRSSRVYKVVDKKMPCYFGGLGFLQDYIKQQDGWVYPVFVTEGETDAISVYADSLLPALSVGSANNYTFLLEDKVSQFNFFPVILPDFDEMTLTSMGAGRQAVVSLYRESRKRKVSEYISVLVDENIYSGGKDINEAIAKHGITVFDILTSGKIEELSKAALIFQEQWSEFKKRKYFEKAKSINETFPALADVYSGFVGLDRSSRYIISTPELFKQNDDDWKPPIIGRFPVGKISVIAGFGGQGKTTFALMTAYRIARQEDLKVLFWTTEHDKRSLLRKIKYMSFMSEFWEIEKEERVEFMIGAPEPFVSLDKKRLNRRAFDILEELLDEYDVIFLDPLLSFVSGDENDNMLVRKVFDEIHVILSKEKYSKKKKAVIFIHHFNKAAIKDAKIEEKNVIREDDGLVRINDIQKLMSSVRGASAIIDSARYVEAIVKSEKARYCVVIKTNEPTRPPEKGEVIPEITGWYESSVQPNEQDCGIEDINL